MHPSPAPLFHERNHHYLYFAAGVITIILVGIVIALIARHPSSSCKGTPVTLYGMATSTTYALSGTTLCVLPAGADATVVKGSGGAVASAVLMPTLPKKGEKSVSVWGIVLGSGADAKHLGVGRPLGFLSDGSLLALTPLGLSRVTKDGTAFQILNAGGAMSAAPFGAAASDLTLIAFQNLATRSVVAYHFDPSTQTASFLGSAALMQGVPQMATSTVNGTTTQVMLPSIPVIPTMVGIEGDMLIVAASDGSFYAFPIAGGQLGTSTPLSLTGTR